MRTKILITIFFVALISSCVSLHPLREEARGADTLTISREAAADIIREFISDVELLSIEPAPVKGLWEVMIDSSRGKSIVYIDATGKYIVVGSILDAVSRENLTKKKFDATNRIDTDSIPLNNSLVMGNPEAKHKIIVFDDPDCPYCARLHGELKKIVEERDNIAVYIKLFPLVQIHPLAYDKSKAILCEQSNEKALELLEDAFARKTIPEPACTTKAVDDNLALGRTLGISGTPTLIFSNGRMASGAVEAADIIKMTGAD